MPALPTIFGRLALGALVLLAAAAPACSPKDDAVSSSGTGGTSGDGDTPEYTPQGAPCDFGEDDSKCDGSADISCTPVLAHTGRECDRDEACGARELCFEDTRPNASTGTCMHLYGECLPRCGGDFDCHDGEHCEIRSGECTDETPSEGAPFGSTCESDEDCRGTCVTNSDSTSECEEHCRVGAESGCGQVDIMASDVACAYFAYNLSDFGEVQGAGDVGICAKLCDCTGDCPGQQKCAEKPTRGYAGVCTGGAVSDEITTCPSRDMGGSGGT